MPIHDWAQLDAGTFHAFHTAWITHLSEAMNDGLLPSGFYALPEQHAGRSITDVLTLHTGTPSVFPQSDGGLAVAEAPPRVSRKVTVSASPRARQRTLSIRHVSGHQIVALVEIVSPANKDRASHVDDLASKVAAALRLGIHVLMIDLFIPGLHDPHGMHAEVWARLDDEAEQFEASGDTPLTLSSFVAGSEVDTYVQSLAFGDSLPDMPVFLQPERYVNAPLGASYLAAFRGMPAYWRDVLERNAG
jgi:hypothetical protein